MTDINPTTPTPNPNDPIARSGASAPGTPAVPPEPPKKKRRRWPWVLLGLFIVLILLILLAPTLLSTAPARSFAIAQVNNHLNGKLSVNDWSLGWTSGVTLDGVKIDDEQGRRVVEVNSVRVPMSLLSAARGNYNLGEVVIDKPNLVNLEVYPDGTNNLANLVKETPGEKHEKKPKEEKPSKLPDVKGKVLIKEARGTITVHPKPDEKAIPPIYLDPSDVTVDIPDINQPIANKATVAYHVGNAAPGTIALEGTVDAIENNVVNVDQLKADQTLQIAGTDLAAAAPFLNSPTQTITLAGIANGSLHLKADGMKNASVGGVLDVANFAAGGTPLKGDTYKSSKVSVPINITVAPQGSESLVKIDKLNVETDHVLVTIAGQVTQEALQNLAAQKAPGSEGDVKLAINTKDLRGLVNSLPNTIGLRKGAQITSGDVATSVDLKIAKDRATVAQVLDVKDVAGTNNGAPVKLDPIHLDTSVAAIPTGGSIPDLRDIAVNLTSAFATAKGGGPSLSSIDIPGTLDLGKLDAQIAQFVDLQGKSFSGTGDFHITSKGDLTKPAGTSDIAATVNLANVIAHGLAEGKDINQSRVALAGNTTLVRGAENGPFIDAVQNTKVTLQSGDAAAPTIDLLATANKVTLANSNVDKFDVQKLAVDFARAQQQFAAFIPGTIRAAGGTLSATVTGSYQNNTLVFDQKAQIRNLILQQATTQPGAPGQPLPPPVTFLQNENQDITASGKIEQGADLTTATINALGITSSNQLLTLTKVGNDPMIVRLAKNGGIGGNGQLKLASNLKALNDTVQAMGKSQPAATTSAGQLTSGILDAALTLASDASAGTNINLDGVITNLSVTTNEKPIQNETVKLALAARTPADFKTISVPTATIDSTFARTRITGTQLVLSGPDPSKPLSILDRLQSAKIEIAIPDIAKTSAVAHAFSPPATQPTVVAQATTPATTQPLPPLQIGGGAAVNLEIARDDATQTTKLTRADIAASKVSLTRGPRTFAFTQPIDVKLAADVGTAQSELPNLKLTSLTGDLGGLAKLDMPTPITVTNLKGSSPDANGKISLTGSLEPLTRLLSVLQGADPMPYRGDYAVNQNIATKSNQIQLAGDATINKFIVLQADQKTPAFTEDKLVLANDVVADTTAHNATLNNVALNMTSSQAAGVQLKGAIQDWQTARKLDNVTMDLSYDLQKLWPMIKPMLSPETQEQLKDMKIAGQFKRTWTLAGSYPANVPSNEAIKNLTADGALAVQLLDTSGITINDLEIPLSLSQGKLVTLYANKPKAERAAKPAKFNGGTLDVNSLLVDLTTDVPRLTVGKNQKLVAGASINTLLGDTLGKYVNPVFTNSKRAKGLLDVTVEQCTGLALSNDALKSAKSGTAKIVFSLSDMDIANPVGTLMFGKVVNAFPSFQGGVSGQADVFEGSIKDATIVIANGRTTQDVTMMLIDPGATAEQAGAMPGAAPTAGTVAQASKVKPVYMPLTFRGDISLIDLKQLLNVTIPPQLISKFIPDHQYQKAVNDAFPSGIPIVMRGTTAQPQIDAGNIAAKIAEGIAKEKLQGVIPGLNQGDNKGGKNDLGNAIQGIFGGGGGSGGTTQNPPPAQPAPDNSNPPPAKKKKK